MERTFGVPSHLVYEYDTFAPIGPLTRMRWQSTAAAGVGVLVGVAGGVEGGVDAGVVVGAGVDVGAGVEVGAGVCVTGGVLGGVRVGVNV